LSWFWRGPSLGIFCLVFSAAGYVLAFAGFDRWRERRNYWGYSTWRALLFLAGGFLCFPPLHLAWLLSVAALVATVVGVRMGRLTLEFHGLLYLAAAAFVSGLLDYAVRALAGTFPSAPGWMGWLVGASLLRSWRTFPGRTVEAAAAAIVIGNSGRQRRRHPAGLGPGLAGVGWHDSRGIPYRRDPYAHYVRSGARPRLRGLALAAHRTGVDCV